MIKKMVLGIFLCFSVNASATDFHATIPVLDMRDYYHPDKHAGFILDLADALREVGFFAVVNPGVDNETIDKGYQAAEQFFRQSSEEKMKWHRPELNGQRGYIPGETAKNATKKDFKEFYHVARELTQEQQQRFGYQENVWPDNMDLQSPLSNLYNALFSHVEALQAAIAESLYEPKHLLGQMTREGDSLLRAIHYPAVQTTDKGKIWAASHTDIDLFTILPRASTKGLQVKNKQGQWITVEVPEDAFIVNGGDMLENLTNGEYRSSRHRVVALEPSVERFSMVLFVHPRPEDDLSPRLASLQKSKGIAKFAKATRDELLAERLVELGLASDELHQFLASSGVVDRLIDVGRASPQAMLALKKRGMASQKILSELARIG